MKQLPAGVLICKTNANEVRREIGSKCRHREETSGRDDWNEPAIMSHIISTNKRVQCCTCRRNKEGGVGMSRREGAILRRAYDGEPRPTLFPSRDRRIRTPWRELRAHDSRGTIRSPVDIDLGNLRVAHL